MPTPPASSDSDTEGAGALDKNVTDTKPLKKIEEMKRETGTVPKVPNFNLPSSDQSNNMNQQPLQNTPTLFMRSYPIPLFKGPPLKCEESGFIPGPDFFNWKEAVLTFCKLQNIERDEDKIVIAKNNVDPKSGSARLVAHSQIRLGAIRDFDVWMTTFRLMVCNMAVEKGSFFYGLLQLFFLEREPDQNLVQYYISIGKKAQDVSQLASDLEIENQKVLINIVAELSLFKSLPRSFLKDSEFVDRKPRTDLDTVAYLVQQRVAKTGDPFCGISVREEIMGKKPSALTQLNAIQDINKFRNTRINPRNRVYRPISSSINNNNSQNLVQRNNPNRFNAPNNNQNLSQGSNSNRLNASNNNQVKECYRCNKKGHIKAECYIFLDEIGKRCLICHGNHSKVNCKENNSSNKIRSNPNQGNRQIRRRGQINTINHGWEGPSDNNDWEVELNNECFEFVNDICVLNHSLAKNNPFNFDFADNEIIINSIESWLNKDDRIYIDCEYNEKEFRLFVDTGANLSVIRIGFAKKLGLELNNLNAVMQGAGSGKIKVIATAIFHPNIIMTKEALSLRCLVVEDSLNTPGDVLMGIKDFNSNGLLVDPRTKTIRVIYPYDHPKCHNHILNSKEVTISAISIVNIQVHVDPNHNHDKNDLAMIGETHDNCVPGVIFGPGTIPLIGHSNALIANLNAVDITLKKGQKLSKYDVIEKDIHEISQLITSDDKITELINNNIESNESDNNN